MKTALEKCSGMGEINTYFYFAGFGTQKNIGI
jgi:hypothetical protein